MTTSPSTPTTSAPTFQRPKVISVEDNKKSDSEPSSYGRFVGVSGVAALLVSGISACPIFEVLTLPVSGISNLPVPGVSTLPVSGVSSLPASGVSGLPDPKEISIVE